MTLILCGFKNCGKTLLGQALAGKYSLDFIDTDDLIIEAFASKTGRVIPISEIYSQLDEDGFRKLEVEVIQEIGPAKKRVIATGGGAIIQPPARNHLASLGTIVYLKTDKKILFRRMMAAAKLPVFIDENDPEGSFNDHYQARAEIYERSANVSVDVSHEDIALAVEALKTVGGHDGQ